ncbi:MAG: hypothetical protein KA734_01050 [Fluviicola sp.]|nr:hypothetical protein [Fluviicola sp.]MBP6074249.1 hypothetical protein [Flavobacterium sp.]
MKLKYIIVFFFALGFVQSFKAGNVQKIEVQLKNLKDLQQNKSDFWDKYSSGIIAGITVLASLGISVWQARASQRHLKSLSISEARIKWIEELRPLLSKLIYLNFEIGSLFKEINPFLVDFKLKENLRIDQKKENNEKEKKLQILLTDYIQTFSQVKLLLNPNVIEHKELINSMNDYIKNVLQEIETKKSTINLNIDILIEKSQIVLRKAWEQVKNEGN